MAKEQLEFVPNSTQTVEEFKRTQNISKLDVKVNPKSGAKNMYADDLKVVGAVTAQPLTKPVVSEVIGSEGKFFLLHNRGEGGISAWASEVTF